LISDAIKTVLHLNHLERGGYCITSWYVKKLWISYT